MNLRLLFILFLPLLFCTTSANAYLVYMNSRIDDALEGDDENRVIVHASIEKIYREEQPDSGELFISFGPEFLAVDVLVHEVILGDTTSKGTALNINIASFMWPWDLVRLEEGNYLLLILSEDYNNTEKFRIDCVVPCVTKKFDRLKSKKDAIPFFSRELIRVANNPLDNTQCRAALQQLGPVLPMDHASQIRSLMVQGDEWISRAATIAVAFASEEPGVLRLLATDIQQFFSTTDKDSSVQDDTGNYLYTPFYLYRQCLFFVNPHCGEWEEEFVTPRMAKECRVMEKILGLGIIDNKVIRILKEDF